MAVGRAQSKLLSEAQHSITTVMSKETDITRKGYLCPQDSVLETLTGVRMSDKGPVSNDERVV